MFIFSFCLGIFSTEQLLQNRISLSLSLSLSSSLILSLSLSLSLSVSLSNTHTYTHTHTDEVAQPLQSVFQMRGGSERQGSGMRWSHEPLRRVAANGVFVLYMNRYTYICIYRRCRRYREIWIYACAGLTNLFVALRCVRVTDR